MNNDQENNYPFSPLFYLIAFLKVMLGVICLVLLYEGFGKKMDWDFSKPVISENRLQRSPEKIPFDRIENGIHLQTGLVYAKGFEVVKTNCTACHSAKLVTQNRASREGWEQMIRWMQATQGLWGLGDNEPIILDYLAAHYAPEKIGRRQNLNVEEIEWYILEMDE